MSTYSQLIKQAAGLVPGTVRDGMRGYKAPEAPQWERPNGRQVTPFIDPRDFGGANKGPMQNSMPQLFYQGRTPTNFSNPPQPKPVTSTDPIKPQAVGAGQQEITPRSITEPPEEQQSGNATFSSFLSQLGK